MSKLTLQGTIVSAKTDKTVKVKVVRARLNHLGRIERKRKHYLVHDPENLCKEKIGATVTIQQCRPMSKTKHFCVGKVIEKTEKTQ